MAARLAERGVRTLVCEEHTSVGDPVHCTGVLSADSFSKFDLPRSATLNQLTSVRFLSPGGIPVVDVHRPHRCRHIPRVDARLSCHRTMWRAPRERS